MELLEHPMDESSLELLAYSKDYGSDDAVVKHLAHDVLIARSDSRIAELKLLKYLREKNNA